MGVIATKAHFDYRGYPQGALLYTMLTFDSGDYEAIKEIFITRYGNPSHMLTFGSQGYEAIKEISIVSSEGYKAIKEIFITRYGNPSYRNTEELFWVGCCSSISLSCTHAIIGGRDFSNILKSMTHQRQESIKKGVEILQ